jgi:hypothetical protein
VVEFCTGVLTVGVFFKRLVQDANDQKAAVAARRRFGELLQDVNIRTVLRGGLKELSHFIDKDDEAAVALWVCRRLRRSFTPYSPDKPMIWRRVGKILV